MTSAASGIREAVRIVADDLEDNLAGLPVIKYDRKYEVAPFVLVQLMGGAGRPDFYEVPVSVVVDAVEMVDSQDDCARLADLIELTFDGLGYGPAEFDIEFFEDRGAWAASWRIQVPREL